MLTIKVLKNELHPSALFNCLTATAAMKLPRVTVTGECKYTQPTTANVEKLKNADINKLLLSMEIYMKYKETLGFITRIWF